MAYACRNKENEVYKNAATKAAASAPADSPLQLKLIRTAEAVSRYPKPIANLADGALRGLDGVDDEVLAALNSRLRRLTVMTFNLALGVKREEHDWENPQLQSLIDPGERRSEACARVIAEKRADVLSLQEARKKESDYVTQLLCTKYGYHELGRSSEDMSGNARGWLWTVLLVRTATWPAELEKADIRLLPRIVVAFFRRRSDGGACGASAGGGGSRCGAGGGASAPPICLALVAVHLPAGGSDEVGGKTSARADGIFTYGPEERRKRLRVLEDELGGVPCVIMCGDTNLRESDVVVSVRGSLVYGRDEGDDFLGVSLDRPAHWREAPSARDRRTPRHHATYDKIENPFAFAREFGKHSNLGARLAWFYDRIYIRGEPAAISFTRTEAGVDDYVVDHMHASPLSLHKPFHDGHCPHVHLSDHYAVFCCIHLAL